MIYFKGLVPVRIHTQFWLIAALIGFLNAGGNIPLLLIWMFIVFISVFAHECGHAYTAFFFGRAAEIDLMGFGGIASHKGAKLPLWKEFIIVLNGPLAGISLGTFFFLILSYVSIAEGSLGHQALFIGMYVNWVWSLANLLPILPLDGGMLLRILCEGVLGVNGLRLSSIFSMLLVSFGLLAAIAFQQWILAFVAMILLGTNIQSVRLSFSLSRKDLNPKVQERFEQGEAAFQKGQWEDALLSFQSVRGGEKRGEIYQKSSEYVAEILMQYGQFKEAYETLQKVEEKLSVELYSLYQRLAFLNQDWTKVIQVGSHFFREAVDPEVALANALACAQLEDPTQAVNWLEAAKQAGLDSMKEILQRKEFDLIRKTDIFKAFQSNQNQE